MASTSTRRESSPPVAPASRSRSSSAVAARSLSERSAASLRPCSSLSSVTRRSNSISRMRLALSISSMALCASPSCISSRAAAAAVSLCAKPARTARSIAADAATRAAAGGMDAVRLEKSSNPPSARSPRSPRSTPNGTTDASFGENIRSSSASSASLAAKKSSSASTESARSSASRSSLASSALSTFSPDASASRTKPKRASVSVSFFEGASVTEEGLPPRLPRAQAFAATTNVARSASSFSAARARRARSASRRAKRSRFSPSNKSRFVRRRVRSSSRARRASALVVSASTRARTFSKSFASESPAAASATYALLSASSSPPSRRIVAFAAASSSVARRSASKCRDSLEASASIFALCASRVRRRSATSASVAFASVAFCRLKAAYDASRSRRRRRNASASARIFETSVSSSRVLSFCSRVPSASVLARSASLSAFAKRRARASVSAARTFRSYTNRVFSKSRASAEARAFSELFSVRSVSRAARSTCTRSSDRKRAASASFDAFSSSSERTLFSYRRVKSEASRSLRVKSTMSFSLEPMLRANSRSCRSRLFFSCWYARARVAASRLSCARSSSISAFCRTSERFSESAAEASDTGARAPGPSSGVAGSEPGSARGGNDPSARSSSFARPRGADDGVKGNVPSTVSLTDARTPAFAAALTSFLSALISRIFSAKIASSRRKSSRASASAESFAADAAITSATFRRDASSCARRVAVVERSSCVAAGPSASDARGNGRPSRPSAAAVDRARSVAHAAIRASPATLSCFESARSPASTSVCTKARSTVSAWVTAAARASAFRRADASAAEARARTLSVSVRRESYVRSLSALRSRSTCATCATCATALGSRFTFTAFLMFLALCAYLSVFSVSSKFVSTGETHATTHVRELPPSESCRRRVSLESRYGTCVLRPFVWDFPTPTRFVSSPLSAAMTFPSAKSPLLILMLSWNRDPVARVFLFRSEPARSTRWNLAEA